MWKQSHAIKSAMSMLPSTWHSPSLLTRSQSSLFSCSTFFGAKNFHSNVYSQSSLLLEDEDESFLSSQLDRIKKRKKSLDLSSPSNAPLYHGATKTSIKKESTMNRQKKQARHNVSKAKSESSTTSNSSFEEKDEHRQAIKHFYDLKLTGPLCKSAVHVCSFKEPTEIQKRVIPAAIEGKHVIASAETGTGKTAAYVLPLLQHFYRVSNYEKRKQLPMRTNPVVLILAATPMSLGEDWRDYLLQRGIRGLILVLVLSMTLMTNHGISAWLWHSNAYTMVACFWKVVTMTLFVLSVVWFLMLVALFVEVVWFLVRMPIATKRSMYQRLFDF